MITAGLYDLIVLALVGVFAMRGYKKGLVNQVGALLTLIVIGTISVFYAPTLSDFMPGSGNTSFAVAFVIIVLISTLVVWNIVNAFTKLVCKLKLKSWNNQMGALLGLINGLFISMILTFCLLVFVIPRSIKNEDGSYTSVTYDRDNSFIMNSLFGPCLTSATLTTIDHLPYGRTQFYNNLREKLQKRAEAIKVQNPNLPQTSDSTYSDGYDSYQYPQQRQPGYDQPGYNDRPQNYPNQNYPNRSYPNQNYPNQNYQNQGYPERSYPNQDYQNQNYPNQNYPNQNYPNQSYPNRDGYNGSSNQSDPFNGIPMN